MRMRFAGLVLLTLALATAVVPAAGAQVCQIQQVTHYGGGDGVEVGFYTDIGGNLAAYQGNLRPFGGFWWGAILFDRTAPAGSALRAVTEDDVFGIFSGPALDAAGKLMAFTSRREYVPGGNPDGNEEVFVFDVGTGAYVQETVTATGFNSEVDLSGDGSRLVFNSTDDLLVPSKLYVLDRETRARTLVAETFGRGPRLDGDGSRVAFRSTADLVPGSNPSHLPQVFLYDLPTASLRQLSRNTTGLHPEFGIDASGDRVVFESSGELVPGGNPDGSSEVYLYEAASGQLTQITHTPAPGSGNPAISGDGLRIFFSANGDPSGGSSTVLGLYLFDMRTGIFQALGDGGFRVSVNHDGTFIAYIGSDESTVPDASAEVFVAACDRQVTEVPALGGPGLAALALLLAVAGFLALRHLP
jgi:Tol biopolymer transport system component